MSTSEIDSTLKLAQLLVLIVQLLAPIGYLVSLIFIIMQLRIASRALKAGELTQRRQSFSYLQESLSAEQIKTMMLHRYSHFDEHVYQEHYKGRETRIASYFLMKRKYFHYYSTLSMNKESKDSDPTWRIPDFWLTEQASYQEFRDVHARHKRYFTKYSQLVDNAIENSVFAGWACEK
ncbi:MAG TPA: hypothetical protein PLK47_11975 [Plasticicumulans sp.]|nr:hypothetical protein [Plasticicumulans sp.]